MAGELTGPKGEPTTIILLSRENIQLPFKFVSLYTEMNTALRPHQGSISMQGTLVKGHNVFVKCSATNRASALHSSPYKACESSKKKRWKNYTSQRLGETRLKHCLLGMAGEQHLWLPAQDLPVNIPAWHEDALMSPHP